MSRRVLLLTLASLFVTLVSAARAEGCTCAGPASACAAFGNASAVFVGTVTGIKSGSQDEVERGAAPRRVTFAVNEAFSGVKGKKASVSTGLGGGDCGYRFVKGTRYLVYAHASPSGQLQTGICTRTMPAAGAGADVEFLRALARRTSGVTVSGRVGRPLDKWDEGGDRMLEPLKGVRVTVVGPAGMREAFTDARGRYEWTRLPPGHYEVMLHPPDGLTTVEPKRSGHVPDRGCLSADFHVTDERPR